MCAWVIALGAASAFLAAVANAAAAVLQAAEARKIPTAQATHVALLRRLLRRPRWLLGTLLLVLAWPLQVLALSLAPITIVQPTLATFPAVLLLLARFGLHEQIRPRDTLGVLTIMLGIVIVGAEIPQHTVVNPSPARLALPLTIVGVAALVAYAAARRGHGAIT